MKKSALIYTRTYRKKHPAKYKSMNKVGHKKRYNDPVKYKALIDYHRKVQEKVRKECLRLKTETPCKDCKQFDQPYLMDFDHLVGTNNRSPQACRSIPELESELKKCEIVCVRCHRIRTYKRRLNATKT